ncbi:cytochrome d ubiquinol oxidase subunit II [Actinomycetospora chlora]|uniref:Cytochrome d ubiquinol oxidase subunit II n=1 Tax=Actinomycetospora chlora TaxID=663608 RepID=A0ABP9BSU2_9PSEU
MTLAEFWFIALTVVWVGFLLLEGCDFGVGMLHGVVGRDEAGREEAIGTIAPVWDGNEVWLVLAVGGTFAAFPAWYATMFSGFYPLVLLALVALILRGVSFEFRAHAGSARSRRLWSAALTAGSAVTPLVIGTVLAGLLHGVPVDAAQEFVGGLGDLVAPYAVYTGVTITVVCLLHGAVFLALRAGGEVRDRAGRAARLLGPLAAVAVAVFAVWTRLGDGHGVLLSLVELVAVVAAIAAVVLAKTGRWGAAFTATAVTMATVVVTIFAALAPRVVVSTLGPAQDLTIANTAASPYALTLMTIVLAVLLPVVLLYQGWTYVVFRRRLRGEGRPGAPTAGPLPRHDPEPPTVSGWLVGWVAAVVLHLLRPANRRDARRG